MRYSIFKTTFIVGLFVLATATASFAQRTHTGVETVRVLSNHTFSLMPGGVVRFVIVNQPARNAGQNQDGFDDVIVGTVMGHVKASTWTGNVVLTNDATIGSGQTSTIEIKYSDLERVEADPATGRRRFRVDLTIDVAGAGSEVPKILPVLKSLDGGKTWRIGLLLPAVQKVR